MKRNIIVALLVAAVCCLSFPAGAQDSRNVSGCVYDENGTALANVIVRVDDSDLQFTTDENGRFEGQVGSTTIILLQRRTATNRGNRLLTRPI